ncbi:centrosomal protein POC5 isoform X1 [Gopherus flavomarginatus]|uniref:centrosomal protein POC5 isoform X1 n=2 Tax=Gopherus flavomarginatus TaxID=286002 RepID=UPI0021CC3273|nr:centrosomal protein POC5 isoform X1 [Gopherus flavomarginatus]
MTVKTHLALEFHNSRLWKEYQKLIPLNCILINLFLPGNHDQDRTEKCDFLDQDEYEELLRYAVVTPKFEPCVLRQSEPAAELTAHDRFSSLMDEVINHPKTPVLTPVKGPSQADMEGLCPVRSGETSSQGSSSGPREIEETIVTELSVSDEKVTQIESILDLWSGSLKTNVLTELRKWKMTFIEHHKLEMRQEKEKHAANVRQLNNQMENLRELLHTYEISIGRKDEVITNLSHAIDKQKERIELMKKFTRWRIQHVEARQEAYANRLADRQFQIALMKRVWAAWRSLSEARWKEKVAKACQLRAEEVCVQLSKDYEAKIAELNVALEEAKADILRLHSEREQYEGTMKKAFMRGVCALNLEAMTMFQGKESRTDHDPVNRREDPGINATGRLPPSQFDPPSPPPPTAATVPQEEIFSSHLGRASTSQTRLESNSPVIVASAAVGSGITSAQKLPVARVVTSAQQKAGRTITARITGRSDLGQKNRICSSLAVMGVSPPMSSVIVEKHHPVTQQTISQATAAKYPRTVHHASSATSVRPTGHSGRTPHCQSHTNIQSIKVVD